MRRHAGTILEAVGLWAVVAGVFLIGGLGWGVVAAGFAALLTALAVG